MALAGLPADEASRRAFWVECDRIARTRHRVRYVDGNQVFAVARERCNVLIVERVEAGQLSIL